MAEETLTSALTLMVNLGRLLLQTAKQDAEDSLEKFVPYKITTLLGLITAGADCYKSIGVKKKSEAEDIWQKSYHHAAVREQVEELSQLEAALEARSVRVLVVSFGGMEGAQVWREQTGCTFDMLLDPQRKVYRSFGLGSSYAKVMKFGCLLRYSEYGAVDRDFPDVAPRLLEDIYQMGGDFLLDEEGKVLLSHPCESPMDRPTVKAILQAADQAGCCADSAE